MMDDREARQFYSKEGQTARFKRIPAGKKSRFLSLKQAEAAKRQIKLLQAYLRPSWTLCEIGASNGHFLTRARQFVKRVVAIEPGEREAYNLQARNIQRYSWLDAIPSGEPMFDAVAMFHLFEHLPKPVAYLKRLRHYLKSRALVFVEVPNVDDALISRYANGAFKRFYFQSMHCFYYNEDTLTRTFEGGGFLPVKCYHIQRYSFSNHLQWLLHGTPGGDENFEKKFHAIDKKYARVLIKEKINDTIICVFRKK